MTAEIAVLNKFGVALAADSAITVQSFHDGEVKSKVYNTANKLFSMSKHEPMGIMFYNTVTIGGIPWETIIKCYRQYLGRTKLDTVGAYSRHFFDWLNSKPECFNDDIIADIVENNFFREFGQLKRECRNKSQFRKKLDDEIARLEKLSYVETFDDAFGKAAVAKYATEMDAAITYMIKPASYALGLRKKLSRFAELILTKKNRLSGYSGIVISGFGEKESLPALEEFYVDIAVDDKIRFWRTRRHKIDHKNQSEVVPLADSEAMKTLIEGMSPGFRREANRGAAKLLLSLPEIIISPIAELTAAQKKKYIADALKAIPANFKNFTDQMTQFRVKNYTDPIKQSIASLPIGELGNVAESFLGASQVLKKVNPDLETIGGPVDIAVISKGDGFVWIKRKHYFSETINPTFKLRYLDT